MSRFTLVTLLSLVPMVVPIAAQAKPPTHDSVRASIEPDEVLVDLKEGADLREVEDHFARLGLHIRQNSFYAPFDDIYVSDGYIEALDRVIDEMQNDPNISFVEPNYIYTASFVPNDPMWEKQWSFRMIDAPVAWDITDGKGVTVAVIDTGVAYEDHDEFRQVEDLKGVEFAQGYDFVSDDAHANDDHGHGTHVAGTIAQATNNGVGVAGLAYHARIMPLKVLNRNGQGTAADIADAIRFAADEGANVINMSLGGGGRSLAMESAVAYARKKGVFVACAAGNGGRNTVEYPARYPGAFAVSAVGPDKKLAFYSSYGKELAIAAPGGDKQKCGTRGDESPCAILQNTITPDHPEKIDSYLAFQGTSMATPHVAGAAALVMSAGVKDVADVEKILKETATPVGDAYQYGAGVLNVGKAVQRAKGSEVRSIVTSSEIGTRVFVLFFEIALFAIFLGMVFFVFVIWRVLKQRGVRVGAFLRGLGK